MIPSKALLDMHERSHRNLAALIQHCSQFSAEEVRKEHPGFGYACMIEQFHHIIGAQRYWIGVLEGRMDVDDELVDTSTFDGVEPFRQAVYKLTQDYLTKHSDEQLNTKKSVVTWGDIEKDLVPADVFLRTFTHIYHHHGQITAMCRLMGKPENGFDYPLL